MGHKVPCFMLLSIVYFLNRSVALCLAFVTYVCCGGLFVLSLSLSFLFLIKPIFLIASLFFATLLVPSCLQNVVDFVELS